MNSTGFWIKSLSNFMIKNVDEDDLIIHIVERYKIKLNKKFKIYDKILQTYIGRDSGCNTWYFEIRREFLQMINSQYSYPYYKFLIEDGNISLDHEMMCTRILFPLVCANADNIYRIEYIEDEG